MSNNCSFTQVDALMKSLELIIYVPIFVSGLLLNTMALVVFCALLRKWTESSIYMTNLALMDLLLLLLLPFKMHATNHLWSTAWKVPCSFMESMYFVGMYGSIYTIACISIDRYIAINYPFQAKWFRSKKNALVVCIGIWVFVLLVTTPTYSFHENIEGHFHCFHGFSNKGWNPVLIACLEVFGFLLPALVLVVCSTLSIRTLRHSERNSTKSQAGIRIISSSLCAFLLPFTPCHIGIFLQFLVRYGTITNCHMQVNIALFVQVAMSLANITCCLNALCYYLIAKEVRATKVNVRPSISVRKTTNTSEV